MESEKVGPVLETDRDKEEVGASDGITRGKIN